MQDNGREHRSDGFKTEMGGFFMDYILETKDLKKYYGSEPNVTRALDGVSVAVRQGEFVSIIGTSGSGGHVKIRLS